MRKPIIIIAVLGALFVLIVIGVAFGAAYSTRTKLSPTAPSTNLGLSDDRVLMGASHFVFVGKVLDQVGRARVAGRMPGAQFNVDVVQNIKGNIKGTVVVNQWG